MRQGDTTPRGGVHISMGHLGPDKVRQMFKGMVERCADVGYDLAGGLVEVVPTAHYMMGGVEISIDCETGLDGLYCAGEDSGGVHGSNRLGGNGVANSTVYGGIAGEVMADFVNRGGDFVEPDAERIAEAHRRAERPFELPAGDLNALRLRLLDHMWDDAGIIRSAESLRRAVAFLGDVQEELAATGIPDTSRAFNLTWQDWLNLDSQIRVGQAIVAAAEARENSLGAHHREDFPEPGDDEKAYYTKVRQIEDRFEVTTETVAFTRVRPGQSLIPEEQAA